MRSSLRNGIACLGQCNAAARAGGKLKGAHMPCIPAQPSLVSERFDGIEPCRSPGREQRCQE